MNIQINDNNYHLARLDNKDKNYILNILGKLIKKSNYKQENIWMISIYRI